MTFTPFKHYAIKTTLPVKKVMERLEEDVFPGGAGILNSNPDTIKTYRGTVKNQQFKIIRIPKGFSRENHVIVRGKVFNSDVHTIIEIKMHLTFLFLSIFTLFLIFLLFGIVSNVAYMVDNHKFDLRIFQILPAFAIVYLIPVLMINDEEKNFKQFIHDLLI